MPIKLISEPDCRYDGRVHGLLFPYSPEVQELEGQAPIYLLKGAHALAKSCRYDPHEEQNIQDHRDHRFDHKLAYLVTYQSD